MRVARYYKEEVEEHMYRECKVESIQYSVRSPNSIFNVRRERGQVNLQYNRYLGKSSQIRIPWRSAMRLEHDSPISSGISTRYCP